MGRAGRRSRWSSRPAFPAASAPSRSARSTMPVTLILAACWIFRPRRGLPAPNTPSTAVPTVCWSTATATPVLFIDNDAQLAVTPAPRTCLSAGFLRRLGRQRRPGRGVDNAGSGHLVSLLPGPQRLGRSRPEVAVDGCPDQRLNRLDRRRRSSPTRSLRNWSPGVAPSRSDEHSLLGSARCPATRRPPSPRSHAAANQRTTAPSHLRQGPRCQHPVTDVSAHPRGVLDLSTLSNAAKSGWKGRIAADGAHHPDRTEKVPLCRPT